MNNNTVVKSVNKLWAILNNKCPHCRKGNMFVNKSAYSLKGGMKMHNNCTECGQLMEIEDGFYYGTGYVSYALTVAFSVSTFVAWWVIIGLSVHDNRVFWWFGTNSILLLLVQPLFMRLSRAIWLSIFVKYNANWKAKKTKILPV